MRFISVIVASAVALAVPHRDALLSVRARSTAEYKALYSSKLSSTARPITRVINLLKEMQSQLASEGKKDDEQHDKLACWCATNNKEKSDTVKAGEEKVAQLTATIEELTGTSAELTETLKQLKEELAADTQALAEATEMREKQAAEFHGAEKEAIENIQSLKAAITVLNKHYGAFAQVAQVFGQDSSLLQFPSRAEEVLAQSATNAHGLSSDEVITLRQARRVMQKYERKTGTLMMQGVSGGEIMGVLKTMQEQMEGDLSEDQKTEASRQDSFLKLRDAKREQITEGKRLIEEKTAQLTDAQFRLSDAKEDKEETEASIAADQEFLVQLDKTCKDGESSYQLRSKARAEEASAVSAALSVLTSDDARDLFSKTSFVQMSRKSAKARAVAVLSAAKVPELSMLASEVQLDSFARVKKAMDDMIAKLKQEESDEVKHKDFCNESIQKNDMETKGSTQHKEDTQAAIDQLTADIARLTQELADARKGVSDMRLALQQASENRIAANKEFQETVHDQRATRAVLGMAKEKLNAAYGALLQQPQVPADVAEVTSNSYQKNQGGGGVISLLNTLMEDSSKLEAEAVKDEAEAQASYEATVKDTNEGVAALEREIVSKSESKAQAEKDKSGQEAELQNTVNMLESLSKEAADLHRACDFVLKNFDIRQKARRDEIESIVSAKQILSGAQ
jgi:peroxiredoxin family protein